MFVLHEQVEAAKHKKVVERARLRQEKARLRDEEIQAMKIKKLVNFFCHRLLFVGGLLWFSSTAMHTCQVRG